MMNNVELIRLESFSAPTRPTYLLNPSESSPPQAPNSNPPLPTPSPSQSSRNNELTTTAASLKSFSSNFWGEKTLGFDVLCQNLRTSLTSVKELEVIKLLRGAIKFRRGYFLITGTT